MKLSQLLRSSMLLLIANLAAGAVNYLYQIKAAAGLNAVDYGALSLWLAYVGLGLALGAAAQILSNFLPLPRSRLGATGTLATLLGIFASAYLFMGPLSRAAPGWDLAILTVTVGATFNFLQGQLQGQGLFSWLAFTGLVQSLIRIFLIRSGGDLSWFAIATTLSLSGTVAVQGVCLLSARASGKWSSHIASPAGRKLGAEVAGACILALSIALIPQMDLLNLKWAQDAEALGKFARASLFAKAVFFGALTLLQITLPFHIRRLRGSLTPEAHHQVKRLEILGLGICFIGSLSLYWIAPWFTARFLGFDLSEQRSWVVLSCLAMTVLYSNLQKIQLRCAEGQWKMAAIRLGALALAMALTAILRPSTVTVYLAGALVYYLAIGFAGLRKKPTPAVRT